MNKINEQQLNEWNDFVARHPLGTVLQTAEWGELKSISGWQRDIIVLRQENKIIAGTMLLSKKLPLVNKRIFYSPRGPLVDFDNLFLTNQLIDHVRDLMREKGGVAWKIDPEIGEAELKKLKLFGFIGGAKQIQPRATYLLDLSKDKDSLLVSFEEKTRYNIRLSLKHGVTVKQMSNADGMDIFYDIHTETASRDHFLVYRLNYYQKIRELIVEKGLGEIFIAYYHDKPVAGVVVFGIGKKLTYLYGASKSEARNVMPNHALHWKVIEWAKSKGYLTYDLWGIPANPTPSHPLWGVFRFKKGFNGRLVKWVGLCDLIQSPFWYFVFEKAIVWYKNLISLVKKGKISDSLGE